MLKHHHLAKKDPKPEYAVKDLIVQGWQEDGDGVYQIMKVLPNGREKEIYTERIPLSELTDANGPDPADSLVEGAIAAAVREGMATEYPQRAWIQRRVWDVVWGLAREVKARKELN